MNLFNLTGKTALVTGSARGLGWAFASGLAEAGARIIVNSRDAQAVSDRCAQLSQLGMEAFPAPFDITDDAATTVAMQRIEAEFGSVDILVNNAGINRRGGLAELTAEDWSGVLELNLVSAWRLAKCVAPGMLTRGGGKIINIASLLSFAARPNTAPYSASKAGIALLTKSMAVEWSRHNIQVNAIAPGYFLTDMTSSLQADSKFDEWVCSRTPAARWGRPEELVGTLVYLASAASSYTSGHVLSVDGGWRASL